MHAEGRSVGNPFGFANRLICSFRRSQHRIQRLRLPCLAHSELAARCKVVSNLFKAAVEENALASLRAQPELPTAERAMLDGPITIRKEQNPTFQSGIENSAKHAQQGKMLEALFV